MGRPELTSQASAKHRVWELFLAAETHIVVQQWHGNCTLQSLHFSRETRRGVLLLLSPLGNPGKCQWFVLLLKL